MKTNFIKYISLSAFVLFLLPMSASAQVPVLTQKPLVNQYVENEGGVVKSRTWWNLLGRQLSYSIDKPYEEVSVIEMQNIIFFATTHNDKVKLKDALPSLLNILENPEDPQSRLMAVSAIHAIGQRPAMVKMSQLIKEEEHPLVKRIGTAAVNDYFEVE